MCWPARTARRTPTPPRRSAPCSPSWTGSPGPAPRCAAGRHPEPVGDGLASARIAALTAALTAALADRTVEPVVPLAA
ncbi:hypothetical protein [Kitasatospora sp. NPDC017646]|uniref:hypothetical protein n=1 Tax=Kitasatospora sp. NPDC017646 TaxID=3364024 RepID=UPI00379C9A15